MKSTERQELRKKETVLVIAKCLYDSDSIGSDRV